MRGAVADRRFDDAVAGAKTLFALSRHLGDHPTLIGNLVGLAIANLAFAPLEELIEQTGSPNLFWALANLPTPFIDLRKGIQGDHMLVDAEFPKGAVLGALIRGGAVIMPRGRDVVEPGDRAVVFALPEAIPDIERLFA